MTDTRITEEVLLAAATTGADDLATALPANQTAQTQIEQQLDVLDPRQLAILSCYFGLDGDEPQDAPQIAGALGLSPIEVTQELAAALRQLRAAEQESPLLV